MSSNLKILMNPGEKRKPYPVTIAQKKTNSNSIPAKDSNEAPAVLRGLRIWLNKPANVGEM